MNKPLKRILTGLVCAAALFAAVIPACAAGGLSALRQADGEILGIANRGLHEALPENSLEALKAAAEAGADLVLADVSLTKDGVPVLMEAHSAARMLAGGQTEADVSAYELETLQKLPLRCGAGGAGNEKAQPECFAPTLKQALEAAKAEGYALVLKYDAALTESLLAVTEAAGLTGACVFYPTGKTKAVLAAAGRLQPLAPVIAEKRSNVIFDVLSFLRKLQDANAAGAVLKTTNRYGVNYYKSTLKKCETLRAAADTSLPEVTGHREDTAKWWDDLVSRGYSVIITDDPVGFAAYREENAAARERLQAYYAEVKNKRLPRFGSPLSSDYKKNYTDALAAAEALLADASSSTTELRDAFTAMKSAVKAIDMNYEEIDAGTAGSTLTLPRILLCAGAAAVVIAAQIYFWRKRKTK